MHTCGVIVYLSKIYHRPGCAYINRIDEDSLITFDLDDGRIEDLKPCKFCCTLKRVYERYEPQLRNVFEDLEIDSEFDGTDLYILTDMAAWKIAYGYHYDWYKLLHSPFDESPLTMDEAKEAHYHVQKDVPRNQSPFKHLHNEHKGDWLTMDVARKYEAKSWIYRVLYDYQNIHQVHEIERELQELYGVTELEAVNILNGHNVKDYVEKYHRIQYLIPAAINAQEICDDLVDEYFEMVG